MKSYSTKITAIHNNTVWYLESWKDSYAGTAGEPVAKKKTFASAAVALAWIKVAPEFLNRGRWTSCDGGEWCYCNECLALGAAENLVELEQLNTALRRAMRKSGTVESAEISRWSEKDAWIDWTGFAVSAGSDALAERAGEWLCKKLAKLGKTGGFSNDSGIRKVERSIYVRETKAGTAHVVIHSHMIAD